MLRIYDVVIGMTRDVIAAADAVERRDRDLGRQLRRAWASVALNLAEGSGSRGGTRTARYDSALGSARESLAALEFASAAGYVPEIEARLRARFDQVIGTLVRLTHRRAA